MSEFFEIGLVLLVYILSCFFEGERVLGDCWNIASNYWFRLIEIKSPSFYMLSVCSPLYCTFIDICALCKSEFSKVFQRVTFLIHLSESCVKFRKKITFSLFEPIKLQRKPLLFKPISYSIAYIKTIT